MTSEDEQSKPEPVTGYIRPQQHLLHKDDPSMLTNNNKTTDRLHEHPSRSFKYLQEMTGEQSPSGKYSLTNNIGSSDF